MEETRVELVAELDDWEKSPIDAATMKWMLGGAGEGKTALLLTFADLCRRHKRSVGAFFASNRIADCNDGSRIIITLAVQLMQSLPSTAWYIDQALLRDPHILSKGREVQMRALIVEPINQIAVMSRFLSTITFGLKSYPTLIVIDGLDEVTGKDVQTDIIKIIGNIMNDIRLPIRFLVSSRPDPHIAEAIQNLQSRFPKDRVSIMDLRKDVLVHRDIRHYFKRKFEEIRAKDDDLPLDWPGEDVVEQLVDKASGQFIYATTIIPYIMFEYHSPEERLAIIQGLLETPPGDKPYHNLDELYTLIVRNATRRGVILQILALLITINRLISTANAPAGTFAHLCSPLKLGGILGLNRGEARRCLTDMHSVVNVGDDKREIRIYHKSFPDFLLDPSRSNEFAIDLQAGHVRLYSHLISTSQDGDVISRILGQVILAESMSSEMDIIGSPANTSSPRRVEAILGLKSGDIVRFVADLRLVLEVGDPEQDMKILDPDFRDFLFDRSRSKEPYFDLDDARLTLHFAAPIRKVFGARSTSTISSIPALRITHLFQSVFSRVFPGPIMPWSNNPSLKLQDMYDQVYSHFIRSSQHRDTILQILGQVIIAKDMPPDVDAIGIPANSSSPKRIAAILGLECDLVIQLVADFRSLLEGGNEDSDIMIRQPSFLEFLLDPSRSQELCINVNDALLILRHAPTFRTIFETEGMYT